MIKPSADSRFDLPVHGADDPSTGRQGTTPGSFALAPDIGGPLTYSSPDTPGMPQPSSKTAWDFMPPDWRQVDGRRTLHEICRRLVERMQEDEQEAAVLTEALEKHFLDR